MRAPPFPAPVSIRNASATTRNDRDTSAFKAKDLNNWIEAGGLEWNMIGSHVGDTSTKGQREGENGRLGDYFMGDTTEAYEKANEVISTAQSAYTKILQEFRGAIKNDLASIASSASKVQAETAKMAAAYKGCMDMLNSAGMATAIQNAERLASALSAISQIQPNKIAFAVLDNSGVPNEQKTKE